jgi:hypothetical protein
MNRQNSSSSESSGNNSSFNPVLNYKIKLPNSSDDTLVTDIIDVLIIFLISLIFSSKQFSPVRIGTRLQSRNSNRVGFFTTMEVVRTNKAKSQRWALCSFVNHSPKASH